MFDDFNQLPPPLAKTLADAAILFVSRHLSIERIAKNKKRLIEKNIRNIKIP